MSDDDDGSDERSKAEARRGLADAMVASSHAATNTMTYWADNEEVVDSYIEPRLPKLIAVFDSDNQAPISSHNLVLLLAHLLASFGLAYRDATGKEPLEFFLTVAKVAKLAQQIEDSISEHQGHTGTAPRTH